MRASKKLMRGFGLQTPERRSEIASLGGKASKPKPKTEFTQLELDTYTQWLDGKLSYREAGEKVGKSHQGWANLASSIAKYLHGEDRG